MTRPEIIRADSIDLQDHDSPSAKDHSGHAPHGFGAHQASTLREVAAETLADETGRSPRVSKEWSATEIQQMQQMEQQDDLAIAQNGGVTGADENGGEVAEEDAEDDMDDDMMDKISSSPSIDDGIVMVGNSRQSARMRALESHRGTDHRSSELGLSHHNALDLGDISATNNAEPLLVPYESSTDEDTDEDDIDIVGYHDEDDDDSDNASDFLVTADPRFIDSGWSGECLQESEDIDFEFVYALHTFVATIEGQANATKGDTMVLLDDSNSYWWLVRVVKDSSIGYLPAEHIETPTERLARLNKHRNIDLTSAMLGDTAEKSKNPLKKAIRRRNAKTVTFTAPTYVEASDNDYSSEEEEDEAEVLNGQQQAEAQEEPEAKEEGVTAESSKQARVEAREGEKELDERGELQPASDLGRDSTDMDDGKSESSRSRNGTVRNTDSFYKDDSVETRKITLTPNLLRDDSSTSTRTSNDSKELRQRPSLDKIDKDSLSDKAKDKREKKDKKEKDKKPGMLSGLFNRKKEKRSKSQDDDVDDLMMEKPVKEQEPLGNTSSAQKDKEATPNPDGQGQARDITRAGSKLQKPRNDASIAARPVQGPTMKPSEGPPLSAPPTRAPPPEPVQSGGSRLPPQTARIEPSNVQVRSIDTSVPAVRPASGNGPTPSSGPGVTNPISMTRAMSTSTPVSKPARGPQINTSVDLDNYNVSPEASPVRTTNRGPNAPHQRPIPGSFPDSYMSVRHGPDRMTESPVQVSPLTETNTSMPPGLLVDTSSQEEPPSPVSSTTSKSPDLIDAEDMKKGVGSSTTSTSTQTWNDSHLRTFFDDDADIKDLLVVVYDKSDVTPAGPDHPIMSGLFREENAKLADITTRLDGMLGDWLARKSRSQSSR